MKAGEIKTTKDSWKTNVTVRDMDKEFELEQMAEDGKILKVECEPIERKER